MQLDDTLTYFQNHKSHGVYSVYRNKSLVKLVIDNDRIEIIPILDVKKFKNQILNEFKIVDNLLFINVNNLYTEVYELQDGERAKFVNTITIPGSFSAITKSRHGGYFYAGQFGAYRLDENIQIEYQLQHGEIDLNGTVYCILEDDNGYLWMSTNNGIVKYHPETGYARRFTTKDGLSALEFNTNGYHKLEDGRMLFSNVNGLNIFHPDSVTLSTKQAHTHFSDFELMGKSSRRFGVANYIEVIELPYNENFFSFDIVGIDHAGPEGIKI